MRIRIRDVLLVSSLYDLYLFEEDGRLYELIRDEYKGLNLSHAPELTRVSTGREALELAESERRFDLIITTPHIDDMSPTDFAREVRDTDLNIPIVLLGYDNRDLVQYMQSGDVVLFDQVFVWQGDYRIIIGIIKHLEDHLNIDHDTRAVGVQCILLVEDSVRYYSSFLPLIYTELFKQSVRLISEGINFADRYLRMRARPKILLCKNYEDAWYYYERYRDFLLGIISDVDFMKSGVKDREAGIKFAQQVKYYDPDMPVLLQSKRQENQSRAYEIGASFILKDSPTLLNDLSRFMKENFSFGDFVFRMEDGAEVGRATDLFSLEKTIRDIPVESILFHADRNHFSHWLKARTEFGLAQRFKETKASDFNSVEELRDTLVDSLAEYRRSRQRGVITDFKKDTFDPDHSFARVGGGSLGGKARGISFINLLIHTEGIRNRFNKVRIVVPPGVVLGTDVFDYFIEENNLREIAFSDCSDEEITQRFIEAKRFPHEVVYQMMEFLDLTRSPLAVRSSSLLEDSQYHPFAGVYSTFMLPNNHYDSRQRLEDLLNAIKSVYASTFYRLSKDYIRVTNFRLEEEKMAVIIQKMIGTQHNERFYPHFSGVARSHNFYPVPPQESRDGVVSVALGLGKTVVEGGKTVKFVPRYPQQLQQFATIDDTLNNSQRTFFALDMAFRPEGSPTNYEDLTTSHPITVAEKDGTLSQMASTYSHENHAIYDGVSRKGGRVVTFAPILKNSLFPLAEITDMLMNMVQRGMGTPVEIEFAVNLDPAPSGIREFGVLQMRPMVLNREMETLDLNAEDGDLIIRSSQVLGNGFSRDIHDVVVVDIETFDRSKSLEVASEVHYFNAALQKENRPFLLIGVGRWGSMDNWLGIPVRWEQISGARVIVEAGLRDIEVQPSQGSHFFQNITSFQVGYFTIGSDNQNFVDWEWLRGQPALSEKTYTRHLHFDDPLVVKMNGQNQCGIVYKPGLG
ncbi:MAG: histidine kinase [Calditrichaeota bacterium]|nr:histidine kinase [Calditrichota bacterium]